MKKLVLTLVLSAATAACFGQGFVGISTVSAGAYMRFSNTVTRAWATNLNVGLYWGTDASSVTNLVTPLAALGTGGAAGYVTATSSGGNKSIPSRAGQSTLFQLRAWSLGFATWEDAYQAGLQGNPNALVSVVSGNPLLTALGKAGPTVAATPANPPTPTPTIPWGGASAATAVIVDIVPVPEPSVMALGVLGLVGALFLRRRK